jgi:hypothetical protein
VQKISGIGQPVNWVVVDILRIANGLLAEHWDVIQDEATRESSKSGLPMFGDKWYITAPRGEVMAARPSRLQGPPKP